MFFLAEHNLLLKLTSSVFTSKPVQLSTPSHVCQIIFWYLAMYRMTGNPDRR